MFQLLLTVVILVHSIFCQATLLSSNQGKERSFSTQKCDEKGEWIVVNYEKLVTSLPNQSSTGLRAKDESCASIPILLIPGSIIAVLVYVKTVNIDSGVVITVYKDSNTLIAKQSYNRETEDYEEKWKELSMQIEKGGMRYINLLGHSLDNEMVLIGFVKQYALNITSIGVKTTNETFINVSEENIQRDIKETVGTIDSKPKESISYLNEKVTNIGSRPKITRLFKDDNESGGLGLWAIILIVLGCVTVTAVVTVSAYHLGKMAAAPDPHTIFYEEEPPAVEIIPRVRGTVDNFGGTLQNYI